MINLVFKNLDENSKDKVSSLSEIYLSENNPRYTKTILDPKEIIDNFRFTDATKDQNKIQNTLLNYEGDFSDLLSLFNSLKYSGYNSQFNDPIILVKDKKTNNYLVAEGNRRILALKLISETKFQFNFRSNQLHAQEENTSFFDNEIDDENNVDQNKRNKNIKEILDLISYISKENKKWEIYYRVINDGEELLQILYGKHLVGEKVGMRPWSRSKYYADLLINFPYGIDKNNPNILKKIKYLHRDPNNFVSDYKQAQFIYSIFYFKNYPDARQLEDSFEHSDVIYEILYNKKGISALEYNHSYYRVKTVIKKLLHIDEETFKKDFFDITWNEENKKINICYDKKITASKMFNFLYRNWQENKVTTRGAKNQEEFEESINIELLIDSNVDSFLTKDQLDKINEFDISEGMADKIITINSERFPKEIERFKIARNIMIQKDKFRSLSMFIDNDDPKNLKNTPYHEVFNILWKQYVDTKKIYVNSLAATIRTFVEQLFIWLSEINTKLPNNQYDFKSFHPTGDKDIYDIKFGSHMQKRYSKAVEDFLKGSKRISELILSLNFLYGNNNQPLATKHAEFLDENIEEINEVLNEFIHASHRIYKNGSYEYNLKILEKWQKFMYEVYENIDSKSFEKITSEYEN